MTVKMNRERKRKKSKLKNTWGNRRKNQSEKYGKDDRRERGEEGGRETGGSRWKVCVAGAGCRGSH